MIGFHASETAIRGTVAGESVTIDLDWTIDRTESDDHATIAVCVIHISIRVERTVFDEDVIRTA